MTSGCANDPREEVNAPTDSVSLAFFLVLRRAVNSAVFFRLLFSMDLPGKVLQECQNMVSQKCINCLANKFIVSIFHFRYDFESFMKIN